VLLLASKQRAEDGITCCRGVSQEFDLFRVSFSKQIRVGGMRRRGRRLREWKPKADLKLKMRLTVN
jgi:hypothetical protein